MMESLFPDLITSRQSTGRQQQAAAGSSRRKEVGSLWYQTMLKEYIIMMFKPSGRGQRSYIVAILFMTLTRNAYQQR